MRELRALMDRSNADVAAKLAADGMAVEPMPEAEVAKLRAAVQPVIGKYKPVVGTELVDEVMATVARVRNSQ